MRYCRSTICYLPFLITMICCMPALALSPDQLLLIANSNSLEGGLLVKHYCEVRGVPKENVLALTLPAGEDISFMDYERLVVPQVRRYLRQHQLEKKIRCLVTFYGMPIRIRAQQNTPDLQSESQGLAQGLRRIVPKLEPMVVSAENFAASVDPDFQPQMGGGSTEDLTLRANRAGLAILLAMNHQSDPAQKKATLDRFINTFTPLFGLGPLLDRPGVHVNFSDTPAGQRAKKIVDEYQAAKQSVASLKDRPYDPSARQELRRLIGEYFGLLEYARLFQGQEDFIQTADAESALDNELPLVMWDYYPRTRWLMNPYRYDSPPRHLPPTFMTMRIDAPTADIARRMIDDSIAVEKTGLKGLMVIDARSAGSHADGYAECDLHLRYLAELVKAKAKISLMYDDRAELITRPPGNHIKNVALYVGWYSPNAYVPAFDFVPGSVGFHIASFTMTTLHSFPGNWCTGLMHDGIDATLGPCDEPYLSAFPLPDEFFPLLMTGKLPLAEVYWKTTPMTSWMMSMIGDPLYTPFKVNPPLAVSDLPITLQGAITEDDSGLGR